MKYLLNSKHKLNIYSFNNLNSLGAKRKIEKLVVEPSEHLINIAKNSDDVVVLPDEYYPKWLHDYSKRNLVRKLSEYEHIACLGYGIPYNQDAINWFKLTKKIYRRHIMASRFYSSTKWKTKRGKHRKNLYARTHDELTIMSMFEHGLRALTPEEIQEGKDEFDILEEIDMDDMDLIDDIPDNI